MSLSQLEWVHEMIRPKRQLMTGRHLLVSIHPTQVDLVADRRQVLAVAV